MIADGDAKTYKAICDAKPYGPDVEIVKHECMGHVQKRMMNHLKALKQSNPVDSDGRRVRIGGQNWITDVVMKQYQRYYGKAIHSHTNDPEGMKKAVWAIFYHSVSTDTSPQHHFCPEGELPWCKYQCAVWKNVEPLSHNSTIPAEIAPFVKTVFEKLSDNSLMQRCVLGATQNQNESFSRCPRTEFCSMVVVETAVNMAVMAFNSGMKPSATLLQCMGHECNPSILQYLNEMDDKIIYRAEVKDQEAVKQRRRAMSIDRMSLMERQVTEEDVIYGAGDFN